MENKLVQNPLEIEAYALAKRLLYNLSQKESDVQKKYEYYDADNDIRDFGVSTPRAMRNSHPGIGWASRAVNTLSDRVVFDGFAKDTYGINRTLSDINGFSVIGQGAHDTFIAGCAFVAVADDPINDRKILIPFTAQEATGEVDQTTGLLRHGLAVTKWGSPLKKNTGVLFSPKDYLLFTRDYTFEFRNRVLYDIHDNPTGRTLLHPLTHRSSANRPLGKSRLTNTARRIINEVGRLKRREEIAEEFYALPQRYITGLAEGTKKDDALDSAIGKVWAITKDDDGDAPTVGQLQQMSIEGFVGAKKDKARDFCAETALTLRNLGYETGNPTSAESLSAMSDDLLLEANKSQTEMGEQIKQIAITLRMAMDGTNVVPDALNELVPSWKPVFQVDVGQAGDAVNKVLQLMPELQGSTALYRMLGIGVREAEELAAKRLANTSATFMNNGGTQ